MPPSGVVFVALALGGVACETQVPLKAGSEVFSATSASILRVRLENGDRRAEAHRFPSEDTFAYAFEKRGNQFERCMGSPTRDSTLAKLFSIRIAEVVKQSRAATEFAHSSGWMDLEIGENMPPDTWFQIRLLQHPTRRGFLYTRLPGDARTFIVDAAPFLAFLNLRCGGS